MFKLDAVYLDTDPRWYSSKNARVNIITLVTQGTCIYWIDGKEVILHKGDLLFVPACAQRYGTSDPLEPHVKYSVIFTEVDPQCPLPLLHNKSHIKLTTQQFDYFKQRFQLLFQRWIGQQKYYYYVCKSILEELSALINEELDAKFVSSNKRSLVKRMEQYILDHYQSNITIRDLAKQHDLNPNYAIAVFREVTGQPPIQYLLRIRIAAACDLLHHTEMSIAEIADYLGFCNQSYMNRVFKKVTGVPPSAMRRNQEEA
jgi:AraC-like DNA-binding protein